MQYTCGRNGEAPSQVAGRSSAHARSQLDPSQDWNAAPPGWRTIDWSQFEPQPGDAEPTPFSFLTGKIDRRADLLPHRLYHGRNAADTARGHPASPLTAGRSQASAALLPVHRRQDRQVSRQSASPDFSRTGRPRHKRGVRERHVHQHAHRRADCRGGLPSRVSSAPEMIRPGYAIESMRSTRGNSTTRCRSSPSASLSRRPDQRHVRL